MEDLNRLYAKKFPKLLSLYTMEMEIGKGGQGTVFLVTRRADGELLACKTVKAGEDADHEVQTLRRMQGNPGVVGLYEVMHDASSKGGHDHLVIELCDCTLRDRVKRVGGLVESEAACLMKNLTTAVQDLHSKGILHRDLKADNVLLTAEAPPYQVKITDMGAAVDFTKGSILKADTMSGTFRYLAPEVTLGRYSEAVDVWGLGLILYEALSGVLAFSSLSSEAVVNRLIAGVDLTLTLDWSKVKVGAKEFILQMLNLDPEKRLTVEEILKHPWIAQFDKTSKQSKKRKGDQVVSRHVAEEAVQKQRKRNNAKLTSGNWCEVKPCAVAG